MNPRSKLIIVVVLLLVPVCLGLYRFRGPLQDMTGRWTGGRIFYSVADDTNDVVAVETLDDLTNFIGGTASEIAVSDDGDGTVTLGLVDPVIVAKGGTGAVTLADGGVLLGSGTGTVTAMGALADGSIVVGDGVTDPVALAAFTSSTGTLKHEKGGLEADVSSYTGIPALTGGATYELNTPAELETAAGLGAYASDILAATSEANFKSIVNLEVGTDVQAHEPNLTTWGGITPHASWIDVLDGTTTTRSNVRTAAAQMGRPFINVKTDYGATGDGETDDTAAIQAAIDAAHAERTAGTYEPIVYCPDGKYMVTNVTVYNGTRLEGAGMHHTYIVAEDGTTGWMFEDDTSAVGICFKNLCIDGDDCAGLSGVTLGYNGTAFGSYASIEDCLFRNFSDDDQYGIKINQNAATFKNLEFADCHIGAWIDGGSADMEDLKFSPNATAAYGLVMSGPGQRLRGFHCEGDPNTHILVDGYGCALSELFFYMAGGNDPNSCIEIGDSSENTMVFGAILSYVAPSTAPVNGMIYDHSLAVSRKLLGKAFATYMYTIPYYHAATGLVAPWSLSAAPTTGTWIKGDVVFNSSPDAGEARAWVCTANGTPGTWADIVQYATGGLSISNGAAPGHVDLYENSGNGTNKVRVIGQANQSANTTVTLGASSNFPGDVNIPTGSDFTVNGVAVGSGYTDLTSFVDQTAWRVFYSDASGDVTELALGADGTYLRSNGAAAAPTFGTPGGSGDMLASVYDVLEDGFVDGNDTEYNATSWDGNINAPSMNAVRDKIETLAGGHDAVTLASDANGILSLSSQEIGLDTQTALYVFAASKEGGGDAADPTFRRLDANDLVFGAGAPLDHGNGIDFTHSGETVTISVDTSEIGLHDAITLDPNMTSLFYLTDQVIEVNLATPADGVTKLSTADQIYDWGVAAFDPLGEAASEAMTLKTTYDFNDIADGATAYGWGDHDGLYDPVGTGAAEAMTLKITYDFNDIANGATAYGWGEHTNLTHFIEQTAWRWFYSDASGDVREVALGADGTFLMSNGAAAAPTFETPALETWLIDPIDYGADDTDDVNDSSAFQAAINAALSSHKGLLVRRTSTDDTGYYRWDSPVRIGEGSTIAGLTVESVRWPVIKWGGATGQTMLTCTGLAESSFDGALVIDGNDVADVSGVKFVTNAVSPAQRNTFDHLWVVNCPGVGVTVKQGGGPTLDYYSFRQCCFSGNGVNLLIQGGARQVAWYDGYIGNADTYGVQIDAGEFKAYNGFFAHNSTSDFYLNGSITSLKVYGGNSESAVILTNSAAAESGSVLLGPIVFDSLTQAAVSPAEDVITYTGWHSIAFRDCRFQGNVNIGSNCQGYSADNTEFTAGDFTGTCAHSIRSLPTENRLVIGDFAFFFDQDHLDIEGSQALVEDDIGAKVLAPDGDGAALTAVDAATGDSATDFFDAGEIPDARIADDITAGTAAVATAVTITDNEDTAENNPLVFVAGGDPDGGNLGLESDGTTYYTPSTGIITATGFAGALTGNVTGNASGTAATFTGSLTGDVTSTAMATDITESVLGVGGSDTIFPADPGEDKYLMWDDDPGALVWASGSAGGDAWGDAVDADILPTGNDNTYNLGSEAASFADIWWDGTGHGDLTGDLTGNADTVTNATFTTALTVNTGTVTLTGDAANNSVLTLGAGAASVSGANTGDNTVATSGDSATAFFDAGTIEHEWGGLQADISAWTGLIGITGADTTVEVDTFAELDTAIADKTLVNEEDAATWDALQTFGLGITITTGDPLTVGVVRWDDGSDKIDGEQLADNSVDADSLDWGAFTDLGEGGAVTWGNLAEGELADSTVVSADIKDGTIAVADLADAAKLMTINFVIDGGGEAITTGVKGDIKAPYGFTITSVYLLADQSGSIQVDIWEDSYANFPPDNDDSLTDGGTSPVISSATKYEDTSLTSWDVTITAGNILRINVDSCTTITRCTLVINGTKT